MTKGGRSCVADKVLVLRPGVRHEPLRWESQVQGTGPPETSRPHVIPTNERSPRDLHLNAKTQLHPMASKLHCWMPHAKQDRNTTPPISREAAKIILSSQKPQNTPRDTALPTRKTRSSPTHQNTGTTPLHQKVYTSH